MAKKSIQDVIAAKQAELEAENLVLEQLQRDAQELARKHMEKNQAIGASAVKIASLRAAIQALNEVG